MLLHQQGDDRETFAAKAASVVDNFKNTQKLPPKTPRARERETQTVADRFFSSFLSGPSLVI
jgi:hypothetical protein